MEDGGEKMDTIAAIATQGAAGGVGIIRLSGPDALPIGKSTFQGLPAQITPRHLYYGTIVAGAAQTPIDQALFVWMPGPNSFTGEDVIELQCHGGVLNQREVLRAVLEAGARMAERGEFSRRAFLNDKIDLTQAEGLLDVIEADSLSGLKAAHGQLRGQLSNEVEALRKEVLQVISHVEVNIDFLQEDVPMFDPNSLAERVDRVADITSELLATYTRGRLVREGLNIALAGPPNAGKSSLFNALLREQRAIVTDTPGTTRDYLEEKLDLDGFPVVLVDTAGVRESLDPVEKEGVIRSQQRAKQADLLLLLFDGAVAPPDNALAIVDNPMPDKTLVVANKNDLGLHEAWTQFTTPFHSISAKDQKGIDGLIRAIKELAGWSDETASDRAMITRARHYAALERARKALLEASNAFRVQMPFEIVAGELQLALEAIGEIVGATTTDDILDHIFSEFCIGK